LELGREDALILFEREDEIKLAAGPGRPIIHLFKGKRDRPAQRLGSERLSRGVGWARRTLLLAAGHIFEHLQRVQRPKISRPFMSGGSSGMTDFFLELPFFIT
jgi:hypothetical protein